MNGEIAKAHVAALSDWATSYERSGEEGTYEVAFLLRRAARMIGRIGKVDEALLPREPVSPTRDASVDAAKPDAEAA